MGVRRLALANGPNIFQMLLVFIKVFTGNYLISLNDNILSAVCFGGLSVKYVYFEKFICILFK